MEIIQFIQNHKVLELTPKFVIYLLAIYFAFKLFDFITGLTRTWVKQEKFQSAIMREGIGRWIGEVIGLAVIIIIDLLFGLNFTLTYATLGLFLYKEIGSIKENLEKLDVTLPELLEMYLNKISKGDFKK